MIKLLNILNELKINDPNIIQIGFIEMDRGEEHIWIDENIVLNFLLPYFPTYEQAIKNMVEEWNDFGSSKEEMFIKKGDLINQFDLNKDDYN